MLRQIVQNAGIEAFLGDDGSSLGRNDVSALFVWSSDFAQFDIQKDFFPRNMPQGYSNISLSMMFD